MRSVLAVSLLGLAHSAAAQSSPYCVTKNADPSSLEALKACQARKQAEMDKAYEKKHGEPPPDSLTAKLADIQKSEMDYYLAKHPEQAPLGEKLMDDSDLPPELAKKDEKTEGKPDGKSEEKPKKKKRKSQGSVADDDPDLIKLAADLKKKSNNGKKGMTPEMSGEVRAMLKAKQGDLSPDMASFLDAVDNDRSQNPSAKGPPPGTDDELSKFLLNPEKKGSDPDKGD